MTPKLARCFIRASAHTYYAGQPPHRVPGNRLLLYHRFAPAV